MQDMHQEDGRKTREPSQKGSNPSAKPRVVPQGNFNTDKPLPTKPPAEQPSLIRDWWLWELLAALLSLCTFAAICIVLLNMNDRSLPKLPNHISVSRKYSVLVIVTVN